MKKPSFSQYLTEISKEEAATITKAVLLSEDSTAHEIKKLSELPPATVEHLKRLITKASSLKRGSRDEDLPDHWSNALELVHWAYEKSNVERPQPFMRNAWKQYEDVISHAVKMLARFRGLNGAWRLSAIEADLTSL